MRPRRDPVPKVPAGVAAARKVADRTMAQRIRLRVQRGRRSRDDGGEPCPVEPDRPLDLSGGAAAALEFDA